MPTFGTADIVALAALLVSALSVIFTFFQNKDNNKNALTQLVKRWELDQQSKQAELDVRREQEEGERKAKAQAELNSLYTNAIASLSFAGLMADNYGQSKQLDESLKKAQFDISQLLTHHYDKRSNNFEKLFQQLNELSKDRPGITEVAKSYKRDILEMMNSDTRLVV